MNTKTINVAIQILPLKSVYTKPLQIIDRAIEIIKRSGLNHKVCPFETVIEGDYDDVMQLVKDVQDECYRAGAEEVICNLKIHSNMQGNVSIHEKLKKYS